MGCCGGKSKNTISPEDPLALPPPAEELPPPPEYDFPLWNEYSKDKLTGSLSKKANKAWLNRLDMQEKLFTPPEQYEPKEFLERFRKESDIAGVAGKKTMNKIIPWIAACTSEEKIIDANIFIGERTCALQPNYKYNNSNLKLYVHKPKSIKKAHYVAGVPALVTAIPVAVGKDQELMDYMGKMIASWLKVIVVQVCYESAPENVAPGPTMDMVAAFKWVIANASELSIDASRVGAISTSAGCWAAGPLPLELAARGESGLKCVFLDVPMIFPDDMLGPYDKMCPWHRHVNEVVLKQQYTACAGFDNWEAREKEKDVTLHILHASEDLLKKAALHVIHTCEFDEFRWQEDEYAAKLHRCGVLADYIVHPGLGHMDTIGKWQKALGAAVQRYLYQ